MPPVPTIPRRIPLVTIAVSLTCIVVFVFTSEGGLSFDFNSRQLTRQWTYLTATEVWMGGYWAMLTAALTHISPFHFGLAAFQLLLNLMALWVLGRRVELVMGHSALAATLFFGALAGSAASVLTGAGVSIGASPMVCALIGLMLAGRRRSLIFASQFLIPHQARFVITWLLATMLASLSGLILVANAAHLGGWLFGWLVGHTFIERRSRHAAGTGLAVFAVLMVMSLGWVPWLTEWQLWRFSDQCRAGDYAGALVRLESLSKRKGESALLLNAEAWVLATARDEAARDGARAIELARRACALSDWKDPSVIDTLSAAYAEAGRWEEAEANQKRALEAATELIRQGRPEDIKTLLETNMQKIRRREPIRE